MSDLCLYELEDNVWDEFGENDDHIVPHKYGNHFAVERESRKKPRYELIDVTSNSGNASKNDVQGKEEKNLPNLTKKNTMIEKDSWSPTPDGVFTASCDSNSVKEVTNIASTETRVSGDAFKIGNTESGPADDPLLVDRGSTVDNNLYRYPMDHLPQTVNELSFFENDGQDKENNDLLYYGWPDIGNFEDVDRMFRSCDSTFGLGSLSNEDDLEWFPSSHAAEESEDALKSSSRSNNFSEHYEASTPNGAGPSVGALDNNSGFLGDGTSFQSMNADRDADTVIQHYPFVNGSDSKCGTSGFAIPNKQISVHKKQQKCHNQQEGKRKDRHPENSDSFCNYGYPKPFADVKPPTGDSSCHVFSPSGIQQHKQSLEANCMSYMQTHRPYMQLHYSCPADQISVSPRPSGVKSESNSRLAPSPRESSYASNHLQSVESCLGPLFEAPTTQTNEKREKSYHLQNLQASVTKNFKNTKKAGPGDSVPIRTQKQFHQNEQETEGHSELEGVSIGIPVEVDSSNAREGSCISSVLDEISLEATSFRQLQQVMEKLDIRTKLCIRDSLYRLAKSAEQRHNCASHGSGTRDDRDPSDALMAEETNKCTGFVDIETDTNPIDRSIAHLLFHRPSDPSVTSATDMLTFKPHAMIQGSTNATPEVAEKTFCQEETPSAADKKLLTSDNK